MKINLFLSLILFCQVTIVYSQKTVIIAGKTNSEKDTLTYYFDDNINNPKDIPFNSKNEYKISFKSNIANTITLRLKSDSYCKQTLTIEDLSNYLKASKTKVIRNDLIPGNCLSSVEWPNESMNYNGEWTDSTTTLRIEGDRFAMSFEIARMKFERIGYCTYGQNTILLETIFIKNVMTGTKEFDNKKFDYKLNGKFLEPYNSTSGNKFVKINNR